MTQIDPGLRDLAQPIGSVKTHPKNPRLGDVAEIKKSLERFGQVRPIVVQKSTRYVVAGNHTRKAAMELNWADIAMVVVELSDEEAEAYLLADNRLGDKGGYDDEALTALLQQLMLAGKLEGTGYTTADVEEMLDLMEGMPTVHPHELVKADDLKPHARNPKTHDEDQVQHIGRSLAEHGFYRQVVVANDGTILAGHGLVEAAKAQGIKRVPAVRMPYGPDDPEALKILAGDNAIGDLAALDRRELSEMLREVKESGDASALLGTGFDPQTLANLVYVSRDESEIKDVNAAAEWVGMPEFEAQGPRVQLMLAFDSEAERDQLVEQLGLIIAKKNRMTWSAWWPPREQEDLSSLRFERPDRPELECDGSATCPAAEHVEGCFALDPGDDPDPETEWRAHAEHEVELARSPDGALIGARCVTCGVDLDPPDDPPEVDAEAVEEAQLRGDPFITYVDDPSRNERTFDHAGCDGRGNSWTVPLGEGTPTPVKRDCAYCGHTLPVKPLLGDEPGAGNAPEPEATETTEEAPAAPEAAATAATDVSTFLCPRCGETREVTSPTEEPICDGPPTEDPHPETRMKYLSPAEAAELRAERAQADAIVAGEDRDSERLDVRSWICPECEYMADLPKPPDADGPMCPGDHGGLQSMMLEIKANKERVA